MKRIKILFWAGVVSFGLMSCQKNEVESSVNDDLIEKEIEIENLLADLDALSEEVIDNQLGLLKSATTGINDDDDDSCPVITWYRNSEPRKMIIDFGSGCEGKDGKLRSGKVIITSSSFENMSATRTKTFENFSVNGLGIDGVITKKVTLGFEDKTRVAEVVEELTLTSEEKVGTRNGTMTRKHEPGEIFDRSDDVISSWGEVVTEWQDGKTVTKTISEENPLVFLHACRQIVSGVLSVTSGENSWSIDYGQGDCDNKATITRNGVGREIRIGRK
jgi:hypothetical protein